MRKKTVVFDFDGVIHSYSSGWQGETVILDPPVPGIKEAIADIMEDYIVVVVSTRCATEEGKAAIEAWLHKHGIEVDKVTKEKPPAVVYIDDRAICFDGNAASLKGKIKNFEPWYRKQTADVVEVVRCKDCAFYDAEYKCCDKECGRCNHPKQEYDIECFDMWVETKPTDFCSYGERKESDGSEGN